MPDGQRPGPPRLTRPLAVHGGSGILHGLPTMRTAKQGAPEQHGRVRLRVQPKASRDTVGGVKDGTLQVSVKATPEKGKANKAVTDLLADALGVPKSAVVIVRGHSSRDKWIQVEGMTAQQVYARMAKGTATGGDAP